MTMSTIDRVIYTCPGCRTMTPADRVEGTDGKPLWIVDRCPCRPKPHVAQVAGLPPEAGVVESAMARGEASSCLPAMLDGIHHLLDALDEIDPSPPPLLPSSIVAIKHQLRAMLQQARDRGQDQTGHHQ